MSHDADLRSSEERRITKSAEPNGTALFLLLFENFRDFALEDSEVVRVDFRNVLLLEPERPESSDAIVSLLLHLAYRPHGSLEESFGILDFDRGDYVD